MMYSADNGRVVISLKKHMDDFAEELAKAAVNAYRAALTAMGNAGAEAMPHLGAGLLQKLNGMRESLADNVNPDEMAAVQQGLEAELARWGESAARYSNEKANEIKEIMVAVAATAAAVGERDQRYSSQFSGLTTRLQSIAKLDDLSAIRRSVVESATELKTAVAKMAEEGEKSISQLRAEVANYRTKLEQSEKREAVDPLTGLANRREIEAQARERISLRRGFCLAILDLNGFKTINDVHGHVAGDDLLKQFASELKAQFRATDVVGRWGGDEFVVLIDSGLQEAQTSLERVRKWAFGDYKISSGKEIVQVAIKASIGLAAWNGRESAVELLARADTRMYDEKKVTSMPRSGVA
jgi:diguanylate cyclase (GGDEF)-like protein